MTKITLEDIFKEYNNILAHAANGELSPLHTQGALAYLELKAQESDIVFLAPELQRTSKNYIPPANFATGKLLANNHLDDIIDSSEEDVVDLDVVIPSYDSDQSDDSEYTDSD